MDQSKELMDMVTGTGGAVLFTDDEKTGEDVPWFYAPRVCAILGISNLTQTLRTVGAGGPDMVAAVRVSGLSGRAAQRLRDAGMKPRTPSVTLVSHPCLCLLAMASRSPAAENFRRWLAHTVLASVQATGAFAIRQNDPGPDAGAGHISRFLKNTNPNP